MIEYEIKFDKEFIGKFAKAAQRYPKVTKQQMYKAALKIKNEVKKKTPVGATGDMKRGWAITEYNANRAVIQNMMVYALYMEGGIKAHWIPIAPLIRWVMRKLQKPFKEAIGFARYIQRKKALEKQEARPILEETKNEQADEVVRILERVFMECWD